MEATTRRRIRIRGRQRWDDGAGPLRTTPGEPLLAAFQVTGDYRPSVARLPTSTAFDTSVRYLVAVDQ